MLRISRLRAVTVRYARKRAASSEKTQKKRRGTLPSGKRAEKKVSSKGCVYFRSSFARNQKPGSLKKAEQTAPGHIEFVGKKQNRSLEKESHNPEESSCQISKREGDDPGGV